MGFLPILLPFLEAVTGKWINPRGPKKPFQKMDESGGRRPKKKVDKCAPKPDFPGRPPCVYSGVLVYSNHSGMGWCFSMPRVAQSGALATRPCAVARCEGARSQVPGDLGNL